MRTAGRARWAALAVVCTGSLMNVLDNTIAGVALPAIRLVTTAMLATVYAITAAGQAGWASARTLGAFAAAAAALAAARWLRPATRQPRPSPPRPRGRH